MTDIDEDDGNKDCRRRLSNLASAVNRSLPADMHDVDLRVVAMNDSCDDSAFGT